MTEEKQTTVLVTGGTGLVGSAIQWAIHNISGTFGKEQNENWVFLSSKDADLRIYDETKSVFNKYKPEKVIHLSARVGGVFENSLRMADFVRDNLYIDQNVLRVCHEMGVSSLPPFPCFVCIMRTLVLTQSAGQKSSLLPFNMHLPRPNHLSHQ